MQSWWLWHECSACQRIDNLEIIPGNGDDEQQPSGGAREDLASPTLRKGSSSHVWPKVGLERLESLTRELFRLHDLNGDGLLEEGDLVSLNEAIATLHHGQGVDVTEIRATYKQLFRSKLDPEGQAVPYEVFRTYSHEVLDGLDGDPDAQEMILEQFVAEAQSGREAVDAGLELTGAVAAAVPEGDRLETSAPMIYPPSDEPVSPEATSLVINEEVDCIAEVDDTCAQVQAGSDSPEVLAGEEAPMQLEIDEAIADAEACGVLDASLPQFEDSVETDAAVGVEHVPLCDTLNKSSDNREMSLFEYPAEPCGGSIDGEADPHHAEAISVDHASLLNDQAQRSENATDLTGPVTTDEFIAHHLRKDLAAPLDGSVKSAESTCCTPTPSETPPTLHA